MRALSALVSSKKSLLKNCSELYFFLIIGLFYFLFFDGLVTITYLSTVVKVRDQNHRSIFIQED